MDALDALKALGPALLDAWYVVDELDRIVDFNPAFHGLFPRAIGRNLKKLGCREACALPPCAQEKCLRQLCAETGPVRLDEVEAEIGGAKVRLSVNAVSLTLSEGRQGAVILLRNVTEGAAVQARYEKSMDEARDEKRELEQQLQARTRDLLSANDELNRLEQELARLRRGGSD